MSCLIYLLILSIFPSWSTSFPYGIIRDATIKLPFNLSIEHGHQSSVDKWENCLCEAFKEGEKVHLFTCTGNITTKYTCQFYYFTPTRDEIYLSNDTNIYVIKNVTFEEKQDCCDTKFLNNSIHNTSITNYTGNEFRYLVSVNRDTIISTANDEVYKISTATFNRTRISTFSEKKAYKTVGYNDKRYYFGRNGDNKIDVYDETLTQIMYTIELAHDKTTIRFLNQTQMLVGTLSGVYIFEKTNYESNFTTGKIIGGTDPGQAHAIGIADENAFYVGYLASKRNITLYTKNKNNSWEKNEFGTIKHNGSISDIFVDNCKRIWTLDRDQSEIFIYDQNTTFLGKIDVPGKPFGLVILENYTLVTSHESSPILSTRNLSLSCRPSRKQSLFV